MKRITLFIILFIQSITAQVYYHPTTGVQNTYSGGCQVNTCSGNYYDDGGPTGDYSNNINYIYWTFCPDQVGYCMSMDFTWVDVEVGLLGCYDVLYIKDGPAQNSPDIWAGCGTGNLGTITANNPSGCLTIRFYSDGSVNWEGWEATISCVPCAVASNNAGNSDCNNPVTVCTNANISDNAPGPGITPTCGGCITNETYTNFYVFRPKFSGTMGFIINPNVSTDDFDFALWGPFSGAPTCSSLGTPIRCSYASNTGATGTSNSATDVSEDVLGDGWVSNFNVTANQYYLLMINGWTPDAGSNGYNLSWQLPAGGSLDCTPLEIPVYAFNATIKQDFITLSANVNPENIRKLIISKKDFDTNEWKELTEIITDQNTEMYFFNDIKPYKGINEYKLSYVDMEGKIQDYPKVKSVEWNPDKAQIVSYKTIVRNNFITITFTALPDHIFDVIFMDMSGKELYRQTVDPNGKERSLNIPIQNIPKGVYTLIINGKVSKILVE